LTFLPAVEDFFENRNNAIFQYKFFLSFLRDIKGKSMPRYRKIQHMVSPNEVKIDLLIHFLKKHRKTVFFVSNI